MNALNGPSGKLSATRILTAFVVVATMFTWMLANVKCWFSGCTFVPMDVQSVALIIGVLSMKVAQRFGESKDMIPVDKV